ncbi:hypothetical protein CTM76_05225 [Photobacterium phosphoreum]|uniref:hypothetical protein n=1 Tax=Photobacterium phosphoreum TaxID=659 RepID=UPI0007F8C172|nr:hypothetical protein [Photobacterium phosphoreum]OBU38324.1 hypothetical protein AYY25_04460 [Photobacterium phosphoreum]PSU79237.1 hypothetical protein CTM76_05225 [Photobacterium phosphoreum]
MKWEKWLENWDMTSLKVNVGFLKMDWNPSEPDKDAAWDMYVELLTRVTTQFLPTEHGDEKVALESIYSLFATTRSVIKSHGRGCREFTKIAIIILNQKIRPFTAKWHKLSLAGAFQENTKCDEFRVELATLQFELNIYASMLAEMADVEDITKLESLNDHA